MPKLDLDAIPQTNATGYPPEFASKVAGRRYRRLAPAAGLIDSAATTTTARPATTPVTLFMLSLVPLMPLYPTG